MLRMQNIPSISSCSKAVAEDLTAETFCKYYEYLKKDTAIENPRAMLYRIASNLVIDSYRKKAYRDSKVDTDAEIELIKSDEDILHAQVLKETYEELRVAMKNIKKEYEDLLLLHFVEDMTVTEISIIQNTNENNVRVKLHRAIKSLRSFVSDTA
jgi:RNA polymerase sigma-70 factor (ECF subfamily)